MQENVEENILWSRHNKSLYPHISFYTFVGKDHFIKLNIYWKITMLGVFSGIKYIETKKTK